MHNTIEHLPNVPEYVAVMHGPILLGAKTGTEKLRGLVADDSRWGHIAGGEKMPIDKAPIIIEDDLAEITHKLVPVKGKPLNFTLTNLKMVNPLNVVLEPFYKIHDARYMMYWMALSNTQYRTYLDSIAAIEKENMALQTRTVDFVAPGEQQPEVDHAMQASRSRSGSFMDQFYRDATGNGFFSYNLATNGETGLSLLVRYWGAESGNRKFDIFIDDEKLVTEDNTGKGNQTKFLNKEYPLPDAMVKGKGHVRVKFQALSENTTNAVYNVRLLRTKGAQEKNN